MEGPQGKLGNFGGWRRPACSGRGDSGVQGEIEMEDRDDELCLMNCNLLVSAVPQSLPLPWTTEPNQSLFPEEINLNSH